MTVERWTWAKWGGLNGSVSGEYVLNSDYEKSQAHILRGHDATRRLHLLLDRIDEFTHSADTPQKVTAAIREFLNEQV